MQYRTISISLSNERYEKVMNLLRTLRTEDDGVSRSEAIGRAIDLFSSSVCPTGKMDETTEQQS